MVLRVSSPHGHALPGSAAGDLGGSRPKKTDVDHSGRPHQNGQGASGALVRPCPGAPARCQEVRWRQPPPLSLHPGQGPVRRDDFQAGPRERDQWRATCHCPGMFPVVVCGRERVTRSGRSLSCPCCQRRGGVLSTLRSVRAAAIGDAEVVRVRHRYHKCRRDPVARLIDTDLHRFLPSLETPGFPPPGVGQQRRARLLRPSTPTDNAYIEAFNARLRAECLNASWFLSLHDARDRIESWRHDDNTARPHSALGNLTPRAFARQAHEAPKIA